MDTLRPLAERVHAGRRGWFLARWLDLPIEEYEARVLADAARRRSLTKSRAATMMPSPLTSRLLQIPFQAASPRPFTEALRIYAASTHRQCCHCGSLRPASEWMSGNVPPSIGVQSFSNRLGGGIAREPKQFVCQICRQQYTLEKLAWPNHRDKQGGDVRTFYLHIFPNGFFTEPFLLAWRSSLMRLRDEDHGAFLVSVGQFFLSADVPAPSAVNVNRTKVNGVAIPRLSETAMYARSYQSIHPVPTSGSVPARPRDRRRHPVHAGLPSQLTRLPVAPLANGAHSARCSWDPAVLRGLIRQMTSTPRPRTSCWRSCGRSTRRAAPGDW
ncbi:MAG: hypothetical protein U0821_26945 [Chloroflexota bacterium]